jgi:hypothetical protein
LGIASALSPYPAGAFALGNLIQAQKAFSAARMLRSDPLLPQLLFKRRLVQKLDTLGSLMVKLRGGR